MRLEGLWKSLSPLALRMAAIAEPNILGAALYDS